MVIRYEKSELSALEICVDRQAHPNAGIGAGVTFYEMQKGDFKPGGSESWEAVRLVMLGVDLNGALKMKLFLTRKLDRSVG